MVILQEKSNLRIFNERNDIRLNMFVHRSRIKQEKHHSSALQLKV